ncbi:MAG: hypothetical protein AAF213_11350 [Pseudomonadota bacterium]
MTLPAAQPGQAADQWWQAHEQTITNAAATHGQARAVIWGMATQTLGSMVIGAAAIASVKPGATGGDTIQPRPVVPPREPVIGLPRLGGRG